jgi:hypothetical protein
MKKITIHTSVEDSEKSQIEHWSSLTPEERFDEFYAIMGRFFEFKKTNRVEEPIITDRGTNLKDND